LIVLHPRTTAFEAARAMADHHVSAALVGGERDLVGVVTARDLVLEVIAGDQNPHTTPLCELMSEPLVTIDVGANVAEAARLMQEHACRRLPITEDGIPVGIVTIDDLIHDGEVLPNQSRAVLSAQLDSAFPPHGKRPELSDSRVRARMRRRARADATLNRLLRAVERNSGIADRARAEQAVTLVLGAVCRRLTPQEGRHLIAQLPSKLHGELLDCLDGPDKRITTERIMQELTRALGLSESRAADVLYAVCDVVADSISAGEIDAVRGQLPARMKELFPQVPYRRVG
jgi:uncharacterized protein (DUF2267 family)